MPRIAVAADLETITCYRGDCGILFAVPPHWMTTKRRDHSDFTCPNGHTQAFLGKSREEELREELKRTTATVNYLRSDNHRLEGQKTALKRSVAAQRGQVTRLRNKAIAGVCAFCSHEFANVAEHVKAEHPSEVAEEAESDG